MQSEEYDIKYALVHNRDLQELLDSPLLITMFLWYVCHTKRPVTTITAVELFDNWIKELASRERTKIASGQEDAELLVKVWAYAAWEIYTSKLKGNSFGLFNAGIQQHMLLWLLYPFLWQ